MGLLLRIRNIIKKLKEDNHNVFVRATLQQLEEELDKIEQEYQVEKELECVAESEEYDEEYEDDEWWKDAFDTEDLG